MKTSISLLLSIFSIYCFSQEISVKEVLEKADKCIQKINTISYWVDFEMKYLTKEDTTTRRGICHLKSVPEDSLNLYHNIIILSKNYNYQQVYNGDNILNVDFKDGSSLIINTELYGNEHISSAFKRLILYNLFKENYFSKELSDPSLLETTVEETVIKGVEVYSILFKYKDTDGVENIQLTYFFRKVDLFPIGFKQTLSLQNMVQYGCYSLSNISINPIFSERLFDLDNNIIDQAKTEDYIPVERKREPLLLNGSDAPEVNMKTVFGDDFSLSDYKGKIVILDFWYRSCYPCLKAIPDLQKIVLDTDPQELVVIGVNPFDKKEKIIDFLEEENINYTNIYESKMWLVIIK